MQTHTLNSRPSGRYSGNIARAIQVLNADGYAAFETADGLLVLETVDREECDGSRVYVDQPRIFKMSGRSVDMLAVLEYLGH